VLEAEAEEEGWVIDDLATDLCMESFDEIPF
jgi:hypothetical protein